MTQTTAVQQAEPTEGLSRQVTIRKQAHGLGEICGRLTVLVDFNADDLDRLGLFIYDWDEDGDRGLLGLQDDAPTNDVVEVTFTGDGPEGRGPSVTGVWFTTPMDMFNTARVRKDGIELFFDDEREDDDLS